MLENIWLDTRNSKEFLMLYDNLKLLSTRYNLWKKEEEGYRFCYANHMVPVWIIDDKIIFSYVDDKDDGYGNIVKTSIDRYTILEEHIDYMIYDISYSFYKKGERFPKADFNFWIETERDKKSGVDRLCRCPKYDIEWALYGIRRKHIPINKRIEISLKDGSIDMWSYRE